MAFNANVYEMGNGIC